MAAGGAGAAPLEGSPEGGLGGAATGLGVAFVGVEGLAEVAGSLEDELLADDPEPSPQKVMSKPT